ncbi:hypothetical protein [Actinomadura napierensis]|uniref:Anti-sigma factor n=1 Tax=Actinomadura napierensis TaxID=267854 RepID=A0ABN2ZIR5_9ACTN
MVDEMDLMRDLKDVEPVRPRAFEEARAALRTAMAVDEAPEAKPAPRRRARWSGRRTVGAGAAALVAAAAAGVLVATSASSPGKAPVKAAPPAAAANPILAELAADITPLQAKVTGDATLEIRNQSPTSSKLRFNGIGLYTDDGTYYWGNDKSSLRRAVMKSAGDETFKRGVTVALYAAKGDITTARARMENANLAPGANPDQGERAKTEKLKAVAKARGEKYVPPKPPTPERQKEIADNHIWMNSIGALLASPENPQVRAGVLRILATMPKVRVTKTTTAGQPTLTLVDSWSDGRETLIIKAGTGQPVALLSEAQGTKPSMTYYHNSRVRIADVKAGKF